MADVLLQKTTPQDYHQLTEIYNQAILSQQSTADLYPFSLEERRCWFQEHQTGCYTCWLEGQIVGYAYFSDYRFNRPAVKQVAEISLYLDFSFRGKGLGELILKLYGRKS